MKTFDRTCSDPVFQGDLMIMRVAADGIPKDVKTQDHNIVAHSETGHHHIAVGADVLAGLDPMVMFLRAKGPHLDIEHQRDFDTHETLRFYTDPGDTFIIKRQREYVPEGWRRVED